ncbi:hypothetical protein PDO_5155 [Rhizobium sp. PDO1-076]|uniref:hypothetical protein n=1 Tax=Rhizobium sp. PDO1-076 TaxID=1125979 RepID=UPI00024E3430|nr:hypothetical protein [Rhizobium sp. PDO1-076]EHS51532.1 hypothetical protein PDO_5155 [Rhizobium sp. PDO1-076]
MLFLMPIEDETTVKAELSGNGAPTAPDASTKVATWPARIRPLGPGLYRTSAILPEGRLQIITQQPQPSGQPAMDCAIPKRSACFGPMSISTRALTIRETKFGEARLVPLHATTSVVLSGYAVRRDAHLGTPRSPYFFVAEQCGRLLHQYVHRVFWRLFRQIGLRQRGESQWRTDS